MYAYMCVWVSVFVFFKKLSFDQQWSKQRLFHSLVLMCASWTGCGMGYTGISGNRIVNNSICVYQWKLRRWIPEQQRRFHPLRFSMGYRQAGVLYLWWRKRGFVTVDHVDYFLLVGFGGGVTGCCALWFTIFYCWKKQLWHVDFRPEWKPKTAPRLRTITTLFGRVD